MTRTIELPNNISITFSNNGDLVAFAKAKINVLENTKKSYQKDLLVSDINEYRTLEHIEKVQKEIDFWSQF